MRPTSNASGRERSRDGQLWNAKLNVGIVTEPIPREDSCLVMFDSLSRYGKLEDMTPEMPPKGEKPTDVTFACRMLRPRAHPICGGPIDLPEKGDRVVVAFPQWTNYGVILGCLWDMDHHIIPQTGDPGLMANDSLSHHFSDIYTRLRHNSAFEITHPSRRPTPTAQPPENAPVDTWRSHVFLRGGLRSWWVTRRERTITDAKEQPIVVPWNLGDQIQDMLRHNLPNLLLRLGRSFMELFVPTGAPGADPSEYTLWRIGLAKQKTGTATAFRIETEGGPWLEFSPDGAIRIHGPVYIDEAHIAHLDNIVPPLIKTPPTDFTPEND